MLFAVGFWATAESSVAQTGLGPRPTGTAPAPGTTPAAPSGPGSAIAPGPAAPSGAAFPRPSDAGSTTPTGTAAAGGASPAVGTEGKGAIPLGDLIYLPNEDGRLVPVPVNADLKAFLAFQRGVRRDDGPAVPEFGVERLSLDGSADDERALLTARIRIHVRSGDAWVLVPLRLNEAILVETAHAYSAGGADGPDGRKAPPKNDPASKPKVDRKAPSDEKDKSGEKEKAASEAAGDAVFDGFDAQGGTGYRWWLRGAGHHELTLGLQVPVRRTVPVRRAQLALPASAVSEAVLRVPAAKVSVRVPEGTSQGTKTTGPAESTIETFGLGARWDVSWTPTAEPKSGTELDAKTSIAVRPTGETVLLDVTQSIRARTNQGAFSTVGVRIPSGYEVLEIRGEQYGQHVVEREGRVRIELTEPTRGPTELHWKLAAPLAKKSEIVVRGFEVDGARRQAGEIGIVAPDGFRVTQRTGEGVHRINVSDLVGKGRLTSAYEFFRQPFQLVLDVQEIEPSFSVKPQMTLRFGPDRLELEAKFAATVFNGVVQSLELPWPSWRQDGWEIEPSDSPGFAIDRTSKPDVLVVRLLAPRSDRFDATLRARRPWEAGKEATFGLPQVSATSRQPTDLEVAAADDVTVELRSSAETRLEPVAQADGRGAGTATAFRIESAAHRLSAEATVHPPKIEARSTARVRRKDDRLEVAQQIVFEAAYVRLRELRLLVPTRLQDRVEFVSEQGIRHPVSWEAPVDVRSDVRTARLALPQPRRGLVAVEARFAVDTGTAEAAGGTIDIDLPHVTTADVPLVSSRLEIPRDDRFVPDVPDDRWKPQPSLPDSRAYAADVPLTGIPLRLAPAKLPTVRTFSAERSWLRAAVDARGTLSARMQYRLAGVVSSLRISLPADARVDRFWFDDRAVTGRIETDAGAAEAARDGAAATVDYRVVASPAPVSGEHLLTIDYHLPARTDSRWTTSVDLPVPEFDPEVWTARTILTVAMPADRYLVIEPEGYDREFRWSLGTFGWQRRTEPTRTAPHAWVVDRLAAPPDRPELDGANSYQFSRFGIEPVVRCSAWGRSLIVLSGAGLALVLGFVLITFRVARSGLAVLLLAFGVAAAGMWQPGPLQVLLQPALLGLVLAVFGAWLDARLRAERQPLITLSPPPDLYRAPSVVEEAEEVSPPPAEPGSSVRRVPVGEPFEAGMPSESGFHR